MTWSVLTLVGADQPGIVAAVSRALFDADCRLAEASMMRLGGNFAIMLRVDHPSELELRGVLFPVTERLRLHLHIDEDVAAATRAVEPDVRVTVYGADRSGIVAQVSEALARAGLDIIDLETAVGGSEQKPIYIMTLEGRATRGLDALQRAVDGLQDDIEISMAPVDTLRG